MSYGKVEICGVNTSKLPTLGKEEKNTLFEQINQGDLQAREQYIKGNLRLVLSIIKRFSGHYENVDDLFQIGCIGLMKAIDHFDTSLNVQFSTYAVPMIVGEIRRYIRDNSPIRISRSVKDTAYKVLSVQDAYQNEHMAEPSLEELSALTGIPKEEIVYALDAIQTPVSLYEPVFSDGGDPLCVCDQISDKKNREDVWIEHLSLKNAVSKLKGREKEIIYLRFFEGKTQMEISKEMGISQAQVSRIEKQALKQLYNLLL